MERLQVVSFSQIPYEIHISQAKDIMLQTEKLLLRAQIHLPQIHKKNLSFHSDLLQTPYEILSTVLDSMI